jgi:hypothetical protein
VTEKHPEHPEAGAELFAAAEWYEQAQPGLGHALFAAVKDAIEAIELYPDGWALFPGWSRLPALRTKGTARFPYRVVYFIRDGEPVILAYAHAKRRPGYWAHRVDDMLDD